MKIVIADHQGLVRTGIKRVLAEDADFIVTGEAQESAEIATVVERTRPDALLLDFEMPDVDGLARIQQLRERFPELKIVICSGSNEPSLIQAVFRRGACGYILKSIPPRDLASAIRQAVDGTAFHAFGLPALEDDTVARLAGLTQREVEIMRAVAHGLSNKEIAKELWVSVQTVKFHLTNIYRKLEITNRTEAARWALSRGLG
jgi:DNA-binding NarL/FixJ family response regulator